MNEEIVARIRRIIDHYDLTISTFADKIGVQRSSISHLLSGRNRPSLDFVMKVIQHYPEVNLYWLLNGKGKFPTESKTEPPPTPSIPLKNLKHPENVPNLKIRFEKSEPIKIVIFYADGTFESFDAKKTEEGG